MIRRLARTAAALAAASLSLTACGGDDGGTAKPAPHPVFSEPLDRQVFLALRHTQKAGSAELRQSVTFTSRHGKAVQTLTGRVDFTGSRGEAASAWRVPRQFPEDARATILGSLPGRTTGDTSSRYTVDTQTINYRAASAGYWLRYSGDIKPLWGVDSISHLRGSEAAVGGTLLEALGTAEATARTGTAGRSYTASFPLKAAMNLFPYDLRTEFVPVPLNDTVKTAQIPVTVDVDADGRVTRARADLSALLSKEKDSALADVTALHAELTLAGFGASKPTAAATPTERTLDAGTVVIPTYDAKAGDCMDFNTGLRQNRLVARVPCTGSYDGKILGQHKLAGGWPGTESAMSRAERACADTAGDRSWYTWSTGREWTDNGEGRATCYSVTRG
ncbi:hypothetical protein [Streptomyces sp. NBC_01353]|uniref:hypothetical protein n=1 Tax=Streptomyces sp. NBC_01353 TaxID=2903835 RepID=UPI002E350D7B|nr:hypothetical protein [Streptomyces sp. NBC_01353]